MDGPGWSVIRNFPLCRPLVRPNRHGPSTVGIFLWYTAVQRRDIVCFSAVSDVHDNLSRRLRLIRPSVQCIQAEPNRFAALESILDYAVFGIWRGLKDSDVAPEDQLADGLSSLSGHVRCRQHSERNPGHNQHDYGVGSFHSATLVHTSESCLDLCVRKAGRNLSVGVIFNAYEKTFSNFGALALSCISRNPCNAGRHAAGGSVEGQFRKADPVGRHRVLLRPGQTPQLHYG